MLFRSMGIAGMLGPALFTLTFAWSIGDCAALHLPGLPFLIAAALFAASGFLGLRAAKESIV